MIRNPFKKKKKLKIDLGKVAVIEPTPIAVRFNLNTPFTKNIVIYKNVSVNGDEIIWGKKLEEIPFSEEEAINIFRVKKIPIAERKLNNQFQFIQGSNFGEILT